MLVNNLKHGKKIGYYCVNGEAEKLPKIIGLDVENFGPVSFPLVDPQAKSFIKICKPALFKQINGRTKYIPGCYQLEPDRLRIVNKDWTYKLNGLVEKVKEDLGCQQIIKV